MVKLVTGGKIPIIKIEDESSVEVDENVTNAVSGRKSPKIVEDIG